MGLQTGGQIRPSESKYAARKVLFNSKHIVLETLKQNYLLLKALNRVAPCSGKTKKNVKSQVKIGVFEKKTGKVRKKF